LRNFLDGDGLHATEIDRTFAKKTGTAFDMMPNDHVPIAKGRGLQRLGRTEDGNGWDPEKCGQMHGASVVCEQETAGLKFGHQIIERRFADAINRVFAKGRRDNVAGSGVGSGSKKHPFD
jgi:hypothetical protein